jgi:hypothetical protein
VQTLCNLLDSFLHYIYTEGGIQAESEEQTDEQVDVNNKDDSTDNMLIDFSTLIFSYGAASDGGEKSKKKAKKRLFIQQQPENIRPFLCKLFIFSYTWSFGGHFNCLDEEAEEIDKYCHIPSFEGLEDVTIRHKFDRFVRELFEKNTSVLLPPGAHLLFSYYVDFEKGNFMLWDHLVLNATLTHESDAASGSDARTFNLIPTPSTLCYSFLISLLTLRGVPVLLGGNAGYGKSTLIKDVLQRLSQPGGTNPSSNPILGAVLHPGSVRKANDPNFLFQDLLMKTSDFDDKLLVSSLTFSARTSLDRPKNTLLSKLAKRGRDAYGTRHGEKVRVF